MSSISEKEAEGLLQAILPETPWINQVFSVGGFVRDDLLGIESKDLGLVIGAPCGSEKLSHWNKKQFPEEVSHRETFSDCRSRSGYC
jgi:tRNA nucleotidyltransferase/poly(A) polymerase